MDAATLGRAMGNTLPAARYAALAPAFNAALIQAGCTNVNRAAMFCAQLAHESGGLKWMSEIASGAAYEGRRDLGNTQPGDGRRFKGHGPIQITGRANHTAVSLWAFEHGYVPSRTYFVDHPEALGSDQFGFLGPVWYWTIARPRLNSYSDARDIAAATRAINGGVNGLADRRKKWEACLRLGDALLPSGTAASAPVVAAPAPPPPRRNRYQEDRAMHVYSDQPATGNQPKHEWPTRTVTFGFDPINGWGGKCVIAFHWGSRGGWLHRARWWVRDPNWSANAPKHFPQDHPVGTTQGHPGSERFIGYAWETAPPVGADEVELTFSAPDGLHIVPTYEK